MKNFVKNTEKIESSANKNMVLTRTTAGLLAVFAAATVVTTAASAKTVETEISSISYQEDDVTDFIKKDFVKIKKEVENGVYTQAPDKETNIARLLAAVTERQEYYQDLIKTTNDSYKENINKAMQVYINDIYSYFSVITSISLQEMADFESENYCDLTSSNSVIAYKYDVNGNVDKTRFVDYGKLDRTVTSGTVLIKEGATPPKETVTSNTERVEVQAINQEYEVNPGDIDLIGVVDNKGTINFNVPFMSNIYTDGNPVYTAQLKNYSLSSSDYKKLSLQIKNIDSYYNTLYANLNADSYKKTSNNSHIIKFLGDLNYINRTVYAEFYSENENVRKILDTYLKNRKAVAIKDFCEKTKVSHKELIENYDNKNYYVLWTDTESLPKIDSDECYVAKVKKGKKVELKNVETLYVVNINKELDIKKPTALEVTLNNTEKTEEKTTATTSGKYFDEDGNPVDESEINFYNKKK